MCGIALKISTSGCGIILSNFILASGHAPIGGKLQLRFLCFARCKAYSRAGVMKVVDEYSKKFWQKIGSGLGMVCVLCVMYCDEYSKPLAEVGAGLC